MPQQANPRLRPVTRGAEAHLAGVGAYRPDRVVTNDEIAHHCDTSDAWIRERTGITAPALRGPARDGRRYGDLGQHSGAEAGERSRRSGRSRAGRYLDLSVPRPLA